MTQSSRAEPVMVTVTGTDGPSIAGALPLHVPSATFGVIVPVDAPALQWSFRVPGRGRRRRPKIHGPMNAPTLDDWLSRFMLDAFLHAHVADVIGSLPVHVRSDLVEDPGFCLCDYEPA